jgi:hypothetical protein
MVMLVGPAFSLTASGQFGKSVLFYESPHGAVLRMKKRYFTPPSQSWYVNNEYFKSASDRARAFNSAQKKAWNQAYPTICDTWRDIYMGKQIEAWNLSVTNDLSWPAVLIPAPFPSVQISESFSLPTRKIELEGDFWEFLKRWGVEYYWAKKVDDPTVPSDFGQPIENSPYQHRFDVSLLHTNYYWVAFRGLNGVLYPIFLTSHWEV